jgi:hypothetical protein
MLLFFILSIEFLFYPQILGGFSGEQTPFDKLLPIGD